MSATLDIKIGQMEASPALRVEDVDIGFRNPDEIRSKLGHVFQYFGRVENEVGSYTEQLTTMLPAAKTDSSINSFLGHWRRHEIPHGQIFDYTQEAIGLEPLPPPTNAVSPTIQLIGKLCTFSASTERIATAVYFSHGARHEKLTDRGYRLMVERLKVLGEVAFIETAIKPILHQEAMHLGWYQQALKEHLPTLSQREIRAAAYMDKLLYQPVGAKPREHRAAFGAVAAALAQSNIDDISQPVQTVADRIYETHIDIGETRNFVTQKILACVALSK